MPPSQAAELVLDAKADLGEGALWDAKGQVLYWVDIMAGGLHIYDPATGRDRAIDVGQPVGTVVARRSGGVMLAVHHGFASLDLQTGELEIVQDPESHLPGNRFNDGKCDPAGRFWAGTLAMDGTPRVCGLYRLDPDLSVHKMLEGVTISNGIVWSLDQAVMYYVDTPTRRVDAFDYDLASGEIENRRAVVRVPAEMGYPDGMTIDSEGMLWVALWGGHKVSRWDPADGRLLQTVDLPAANVTSCAFCGENLDQLYITTARTGLPPEQLKGQPLAGGLFRAEVGVRGLPAFEFAG
ncbi:MAG: SMP-30/gluconolactonase/LRE family protein [Anaerolineae bacterium]|nr:SMP-30/gluconolactonase/LRE family protein [Anaerolineae bacterium]